VVHRALHLRGQLYCCVALEAVSQRVVGWAPGNEPTWPPRSWGGHRLARRGARSDHSRNHGTPVHVLELYRGARAAGLLPLLGTVGDRYDCKLASVARWPDSHYDAEVESFWARMQAELVNRQRWNTRVELTNAIFEYIEGFHTAGAATPHSAGGRP
jgi:putative transposase